MAEGPVRGTAEDQGAWLNSQGKNLKTRDGGRPRRWLSRAEASSASTPHWLLPPGWADPCPLSLPAWPASPTCSLNKLVLDSHEVDSSSQVAADERDSNHAGRTS